jgi:hypothetical protein
MPCWIPHNPGIWLLHERQARRRRRQNFRRADLFHSERYRTKLVGPHVTVRFHTAVPLSSFFKHRQIDRGSQQLF